MLLGGHPPTAIHITIVIASYGLFRLATDGSRKRYPQVALLICALLAGTLLAAPQLLPYLEYYHKSASSLSSAALGRWATHLSPNVFIHFLLPHAFGSPAVGYQDLPGLLGLESIDNFNERTGYVGIVTILLALCAIFLRRCTFSFFYLAAALIATAIVFGLPPVPAIVRQLPIINDINHTRLLMLIGFSLAILAGLGLDTLSRIKSRRGILCIVIVFWAVIGVSLFWLGSFSWPKLSALDQPRRDFLFWQLLILAGGIVPSVMITLQLKGRWQWVSGFVCLAWTTFDLFWFAYGYNPSISRDRYYPKTGVIEFLQKDPSLFRITGFENILAPNTAATYGLYDVRGCDFMAVKRYEELITGKAGDFSFYTTVRSLPPVFPLLNIKYVLAPKQAPVNATQFELVYSNEVAVYRFKSCLERALVVSEYKVYRNPEDILSLVRSGAFNPRQVLLLEEEPKMAGTEQLAASPGTTVHIISYQPDDAAIEVSVPRPAFLLLLDTYFPGWVATVNGQSAHIYRADYNFRAVSLPAGKSLVRFTYQPMSMRLGFILSFASMVLIIIAWFWCGIRKESIEKQ
jgi:hypothetical protein